MHPGPKAAFDVAFLVVIFYSVISGTDASGVVVTAYSLSQDVPQSVHFYILHFAKSN